MLALYLALACVSAATLVYEIVLTRLLSVVAWYYLAFVSISTAMLGLTAGALIVQLRPRLFPPEKVLERMGAACAWMGALLPACLVLTLSVPVAISYSAQTFFSFLFFCAIVAVPFAFSGVAICLGLTRGGPRIGRLYAADLGGAAFGCVAGVLLLQAIDPCSAIFVVSGLLLLAAGGLASAAGQLRYRRRLLAGALVAVVAGALNAQTVHGVQPIWTKGGLDERSDIAFESWNAISRVRVGRSHNARAFFWGASPVTPPTQVEFSEVTIDSDAGTVIQRFDGRPESVRYLAYDVTSLGALLRAGSGDALIIGVGGGRDVLNAWGAGFRRIVGLEVNPLVLDASLRRLRDYANLHRLPGLELHATEARSWLATTDRRFDLLQASMVDTWAATSAGAMSLTENGLYTVEAWRLFLDRLKPGGVVAFSRWYEAAEYYQTRRLVAVAAAALLEQGVSDPAEHVAVIAAQSVATVLVSRDAFSPQDRQRLEAIADQLRFRILALPGREAADRAIASVLAAHSLRELAGLGEGAVSYAPSWDRSPYFFSSVPLRRLPRALSDDLLTGSVRATLVVLCFSAAAAVLAALTLLLPAWGTRVGGPGSLTAGAHVALLGTGFMLAELGAMQQLSLLLGHPSYSLVVVLGVLLVASGLGSLTTDRLPALGLWRRAPAVVSGAVVLAYALGTEGLVAGHMGLPFAGRVALSAALLFPVGFVLGGCLPMALRSARAAGLDGLLPWLWAVNGACSVLASFLAVLVSMELSIPTCVTAAGLAYLAAAALVPRAVGNDSVAA
jgi:hypothetical protein